MNTEIILAIIGSALLIVGLTIIFIVAVKKSLSTRYVIDEKFIDKLMVALGKHSNIEKVSVDNGRLKFVVSNLDIVDYETLKSMSTAGVFVTGNTIKLLFQYDASQISKEVSNMIKGE